MCITLGSELKFQLMTVSKLIFKARQECYISFANVPVVNYL